jgi:hypothetical protein
VLVELDQASGNLRAPRAIGEHPDEIVALPCADADRSYRTGGARPNAALICSCAWLLEPMILRAGFVIEDVAYSDDPIFAHYICRRNSN